MKHVNTKNCILSYPFFNQNSNKNEKSPSNGLVRIKNDEYHAHFNQNFLNTRKKIVLVAITKIFR